MIKHQIASSMRRSLMTWGKSACSYACSILEVDRLGRLLNVFGITDVIDVGANAGQFGHRVIDSGFKGNVISFEPLTSAHRQLVRRAEKYPQWIVPPNMALGRDSRSITINVSDNSVSSSILPIDTAHLKAAPRSRYLGTETVEQKRLDEVINDHVRKDSRLHLKIDTQGYELEVLEGASGVLEQVILCQMELSLKPLYAGQPLMADVLDRFESMDFELFDLSPGFRDSSSGRLLQCDGFFTRRGEEVR